MRKFVIKNRQKRKYTRKTNQVSSFSFSKTAYGILPLLIMIVALMTTVVISAPLRDQISSIRLTFSMPEFSINNPLTSIQAFAVLITQGSLALWNACLTIVILVAQSLEVIGVASMQVLTSSGNIFIEIGHLLFQTMSLFAQGVEQTMIVVGQTITIAGTIVVTDVILDVRVVADVLAMLWHSFVTLSILVTQTIILVSATIIHFMVVVGQTVGNLMISVTLAIAKFISNTTQAIIHVIEIPFKILAAFWEQIKPYMQVLGKHIQMSGSDLSNGFTSWGKVASLMSSPK